MKNSKKTLRQTEEKKEREPEYQKPKVTVQTMSMKALLGENGWFDNDGRKLLAAFISP